MKSSPKPHEWSFSKSREIRRSEQLFIRTNVSHHGDLKTGRDEGDLGPILRKRLSLYNNKNYFLHQYFSCFPVKKIIKKNNNNLNVFNKIHLLSKINDTKMKDMKTCFHASTSPTTRKLEKYILKIENIFIAKQEL